MERTFNMGVGMVAVVAPADADRALAVLMGRHVPAWVAGTVSRAADTAHSGMARLQGSYQS
jgi:phosphoribosylformylglycinamidine cyclo-ligase